MTCRACGAALVTASASCPSCGTAIAADEPLTSSQHPTYLTPGPAAAAPTGTIRSIASARTPSSGGRPATGWLQASQSIAHGRFSPGTIVDDRYRIIGLLGKGGMGEVFRADDLRLGQPVALKFLPRGLSGDPVRLAQFHNEVRIARQISHPNVCRVYDIGESDGDLFLSMEYVDGEDLASLLRRIGRFPDDKAIDVARQLCAGLAAAHQRGVLHRDLKPANVMLDGTGSVRLMDFGLAALGQVDEVSAGTPAYMAPEQLLGREVTTRSDIFALGLVLYELFTGRRAFRANTIAELVELHHSQLLAAPTEIVSGLDPAVERAILSCLATEPQQRPVSALAVSAALPGGDPLAAALAAGETPSPDMLAAAGEGMGLMRRAALSVYGAVLAGMVAVAILSVRLSVLEAIRPEFPPEVMAQKARDILGQLGLSERPRDEAYGYLWDDKAADYIRKTHEGLNRRDAVNARPLPISFWYRRSPAPLTGLAFHTDLLTPGIVDVEDPPPIMSGMIDLRLDARGRLVFLEAIPSQVGESPAAAPPVDWARLFAAADVNPAMLQPVKPQWRSLAASDTRAAWTGVFPGTTRPLRVEAAALDGRPVAFMVLAPWQKPWRSDDDSNDSMLPLLVLIAFALTVLAGAVLLARQNLRTGRGDLHGAANLAQFTVAVMMVLWAMQVHLVVSLGLFATFLVAVATAVFNGALVWGLYIGLEPFVRRRWPQTVVSWSTLFNGRWGDAVVGRDVLIGVALGVGWALLLLGVNAAAGDGQLTGRSGDVLDGTREMLGSVIVVAARAMRSALFFFLLLFLWRTLFRRQWAAALMFAATLALVNLLGSERPWLDVSVGFALNLMIALVVVRWGLLSLAVGVLVTNILTEVPVSSDLSAWYLSSTLIGFGLVFILATWALRTSVGQRGLRGAEV